MSYIIIGLLLYILYRFIVGFLLPVISASRKMRQHIKDVHSHNRNFSDQATGGGYNTAGNTTKATTTPSSKDYIEFEEIK